jgi:hypothetical protein
LHPKPEVYRETAVGHYQSDTVVRGEPRRSAFAVWRWTIVGGLGKAEGDETYAECEEEEFVHEYIDTLLGDA